MAYCSKCGREMPSDAVYCPACGAQAVTPQGTVTTSEFERLTRDRVVQEHWLLRFVAFIIDAIAFSIGYAALSLIVWFSVGFPASLFGGASSSAALAAFPFSTFGFAPIGLLWGVLFWFYFAIAEAWYGTTVGKGLMRLHVVTSEGKPATFEKTFIRNFSKINWILLLLDIAGGLFTRSQPGQKFSDHLADTIVAKEQ